MKSNQITKFLAFLEKNNNNNNTTSEYPLDQTFVLLGFVEFSCV